ncbi:MAG: response regulator [Bacteroidetes bacterium]|jgi:PAS domain S-box-containing protein|nr:response regulator [Bacteroidota bacterium]
MENNETRQSLLDEIEKLKHTVEQLSNKLHQLSQNSEKDIEQRLAITINNIPLAIINTDRHGYITAANPAFLKVFDMQASDLIDKQNIKFFEPFQNTELQLKIVELIDDKLPFDIELPFPTQGKDTFFRCRGLIISSKVSDGLSFILIIGDVSKRKLTEHELIKALGKAEESDKLKTAFLASMSHEIRTPMNHIIGFTEFLKEPELPENEREEYSQIVYESSHVLLRLIEDIIDIAKIESGQMNINKSVFSVNELVASAFRSFNELRNKQHKSHIRFLIKTPENTGTLYIKTDAMRLQQILSNILDNAFKFTENGSVEIGFSASENNVKFYVKDTGPGIDPDKHELIFKRFRQLDYSSTKKYGGTGLGLSIVKGLLDLLEGEIHLESEPGKGTTFRFTIPGLIVQADRLRINTQTIADKPINWSAYTFLVVEDERTNYNLLMIMLRPTKAKLIWAKDGHEAVELMQTHKDIIDLVLMDIRLPIMNGYDATRMIKKINPAVPVIAQTAYAMDVEVGKAMEAGCNDYVTKPIDRYLLLDKISLHLPAKK